MPGRRSSPGRTLVVGESLIDVVRAADGTTTRYVGGSPLNVAVGLARLGHPVALATHFGRDEDGSAIGAHASESGVELVPGSDRAEHTSVATATLDEQARAEYTFDITWEVPELPDRKGHLHTGSIGALLRPGGVDVLATMDCDRQVGTVSYDPNIRPALLRDRETTLEEVERRVAVSDVVKASDDDLEWLAGRDLDEQGLADWLHGWQDLGPRLLVCTRGPKGALAALPSGRVIDVPGEEVEVTDTVGAGDSFMAGLLSGLLDAGLLGGPDARSRLRKAHGSSIIPAVTRGVASSARTVAHAGAHAPSRADLARP